ncbi:MAG: hypothetical protein DRG78_03775 [Epsilonproteobacteria bacterium]|nr:MAG: hypothetical protein DRG78_03775 [Campylobacterota bacterium]
MTLELLTFIFTFVIIPLIVYAFKQNKDMSIAKNDIKHLQDDKKEYREDIKEVFKQLQDIRADIHNIALNKS